MSGFLLSPAARADLTEIWDYTANRWGVEQAERYVRDLTAACQGLAPSDPISCSIAAPTPA